MSSATLSAIIHANEIAPEKHKSAAQPSDHDVAWRHGDFLVHCGLGLSQIRWCWPGEAPLGAGRSQNLITKLPKKNGVKAMRVKMGGFMSVLKVDSAMGAHRA